MTTPNDKTPSATAVNTWEIDAAASRVEFSIPMRLMFLTNITVKGRFSDVRGTVTGDESDPTSAQVNVTIGAASIDTKSTLRDKHLRSADFFEVEKYPNLTFTSQRIEAAEAHGSGHYHVTGLLTIRDVTREVTLHANYTPQEAGKRRHIFDLKTVLNRHDFHLEWSNPTQKVRDNATITLHIELIPAS